MLGYKPTVLTTMDADIGTLPIYLKRVDLGDAKVVHPISIAAAFWAWQSYHLFTFGIGRARHPNHTTSLPTVKAFGVMSSLDSDVRDPD